MAPAVPIPMTGFLNFAQQDAQDIGEVQASLRKPLRIEYSQRQAGVTLPNGQDLRLPFAVQGDNTFGIDVLRDIKIPEPISRAQEVAMFSEIKNIESLVSEAGPDRATKAAVAATKAKVTAQRAVVKGLEILKEATISKLANDTHLTQTPVVSKPTPFIGMGKGLSIFGLNLVSDKPVDVFGRKTAMQGESIKIGDGDPIVFPPMEVDLTTPIKKGDFYVRFRDLRNDKFLYFRGFVTGINENVSPSYNTTQYIGRSEDVHIYQKTERDLTFNLKVYPQNEPEFDTMYDRINYLTSLAYPAYAGNRMVPPFTELYMAHIGDRAEGQFGYIKSLTYTVPEGGDWDAYSALPRMFDIAIGYQILNRRPPQLGMQFYKGHGEIVT